MENPTTLELISKKIGVSKGTNGEHYFLISDLDKHYTFDYEKTDVVVIDDKDYILISDCTDLKKGKKASKKVANKVDKDEE